jgi:gluconate kinase
MEVIMEGKKIHSSPSNGQRAILVFGAPCSGKTTFGKQFAAQFNATFYDLDALKQEHNLSRQFILLLVEQIARTGSTLVFEGGNDTEKDRRELAEILRSAGYSPTLIWIQTDVSTIRARLKTRLKSVDKAKTVYDSRIKALEGPSDAEMPIVLSGKHTYATQLKQVLTQLQER